MMAVKFASQGSSLAVNVPGSLRQNQNTEIQQTVSYRSGSNHVVNEVKEIEQKQRFPEITDSYQMIKSTGRYNKTESKKEYRNKLKIK